MLLLPDLGNCARHLVPSQCDSINKFSTKCTSNTNVHKVSSFVSYKFVEMNRHSMGSKYTE